MVEVETQKKKFSAAEEDLICIGAIVLGVVGSFIIRNIGSITKIPLFITIEPTLRIPIFTPLLITAFIVYYFIRNPKKSLVSGTAASLIEVLLAVILFSRAFTRW